LLGVTREVAPDCCEKTSRGKRYGTGMGSYLGVREEPK